MWVARDKDNSLGIYATHPHRKSFWGRGHKKNIWESNCGGFCIPKKLFPDLTWDDEPIKVKLEKVFDKSNPTTFESYGNHLRNLLSPYQTLIDVVKMYVDGNIAGSDLCDFLKDRNIQEGLNNILEFSKSEKLEDINWRENV